jgi:hypothetical protein
MSTNLAIQEAEAEAASVVRASHVTHLPVCVLGIAIGEDIVVEPKQSDEPGVSGIFMKMGDAFGIQYGRHINNDGFIRFTVAHELGHYFLPGHIKSLFSNGQSQHLSKSGFVSNDPLERQADFFAAALLMPEGLFTSAMRRAGEGFQAIKALAGTCRTSITATAIRYARFAEDPVAVIVSSGNKVEFCVLSQALRNARGVKPLTKGCLIPALSTTGKFNRHEANVAGGKQEGGWSSLDDWFDDAPQVEMKEDVVGLGRYGRTLTVLFTAEAIGGDEEDESEDEE